MKYEDFLKFLSERYGSDIEELKKINSFSELGLDSLSLFSLVQDIEEQFSIELPIEDLTQIDTIDKMYEYISNLKK